MANGTHLSSGTRFEVDGVIPYADWFHGFEKLRFVGLDRGPYDGFKMEEFSGGKKRL
ncbi:MAG: hypothetical protein Ct9H300mP19_14020 [Dehalococcoidia bacterium]|nr:MAG: hypothetical protein Ct9H300mP19_14020 [Dehalococcoidia bacterium]